MTNRLELEGRYCDGNLEEIKRMRYGKEGVIKNYMNFIMRP